MEPNKNIYYQFEEEEEETSIDLKKNIMAYKRRRKLFYTVFCVTLLFFISMFYWGTKKYLIDADLYINSKQSSNISDINPFVLDELGGGIVSMGGDTAMNNELELIQSPLVINKVIKENNLRYGKLFNIFPTIKTGKYITVDTFLKQGIKFQIKKGSNVINISYKSKKREQAYDVVNSVIKDYIELHKEVHSAKSKSDKALLEKEYNKAKSELEDKMETYEGLPSNALGGSGNLAAMSAFSESARKAMENITGQVVENERSKLSAEEESEKVKQLAARLQWAELVEEMSNTSKVFVIKEPKLPESYEQISPKMSSQAVLGIIFGIIFAIIALIHAERHDKNLSYMILEDNIIYDLKKEFVKLKSLTALCNTKGEKVLMVSLTDIFADDIAMLETLKNIRLVKADITDEFVNLLNEYDNVILFERINETDSKMYNTVKDIIKNLNKKLILEVLV